MSQGLPCKGIAKAPNILAKAATLLRAGVLVFSVVGVACAQSSYVTELNILEKKPGQQELFRKLLLLEPVKQLPHTFAQKDVDETLMWLKARTGNSEASARYSYAYSAWLWAAGRRDLAASVYVLAGFKARWDGTRCADLTAAPGNILQYESVLGTQIVPFLQSADKDLRQRVLAVLSLNLEERFANSAKDEWVCSGGVAYFQKYFQKHPEQGQQPVGDPSLPSKTIVLSDDTIQPEFIADEDWRIKRKEVAGTYLKGVKNLFMKANESEKPQRDTKSGSGRAQTPEYQWTIKHRLQHETGVTVLAMSPSGREVAAGSFLDQRVSIWDVASGTLLRQLQGIKGGARAIAYRPDGRFLAVGRDAIKPGDLCVFVYQAGTDTIVQRLQPPALTTRMAPQGIGAVASLQYSPDSQFLAVGFQGGAIGIYETATGALKKSTSLSSFLQGPVAYSPNGKYLAFGDRRKEEGDVFDHHVIQIMDTERGEVTKTLLGHTDLVTALAFSPDGRYLVSGSNTGSVHGALDKKKNQGVEQRNDDPIRIWDLETGAMVKELAGHTGSVKSLVFYRDGQYLVSGSYDKTIKIWNVARGGAVSTMTGHNDLVDSVVVSSDGTYLVSAGNSPEIKVWEQHH